MTEIRSFRFKCTSCSHEASYNLAQLKVRFGFEVNSSNINQTYGDYSCTECESPDIQVKDQTGKVLIDPKKIKECSQCGYPITGPRLQAQPTTNVCVSCASDLSANREPAIHQPEAISFQRDLLPQELKFCGKCGKPSVVRQNRQTKDTFVGCSDFPNCRWTHKL